MTTTITGWRAPQGHVFDRLDHTIGGTPLLRLRHMAPDNGAEVLVKLETENPMKSVKDRIARSMIEAGERDGSITPGTHIIEPTSGNTGIALAFICATRGYRLSLTMPESMSLERRALLRQLGAELHLTPKEEGVPGAIARAEALAEEAQKLGPVFMPQQFTNPANPEVHERTTGPEIWSDSGGAVDAIVAGVGTGGTITGTARYCKSMNSAVQAIAVEPEDSPVISGGEPGPHTIMGIGGGFIPANLDVTLLDGVERVSNDDAFRFARELAVREGLLVGISTGANVCAALRVASTPAFAGKRVVTFACSFGERYLSTPLFEEARASTQAQ